MGFLWVPGVQSLSPEGLNEEGGMSARRAGWQGYIRRPGNKNKLKPQYSVHVSNQEYHTCGFLGNLIEHAASIFYV